MDTIDLSKRDQIWTVTLNAPERLNAIDVAMSERLAGICAEARVDPAIRGMIITGTGRAFCAGGNLRPSGGLTGDAGQSVSAELQRFYRRCLSVRDVPVPTLAVINGYALGAGLCLALACDMRFAADSAKLGFNFAKLALHPGMAATYLLTRTVGYARACELFFSGELVSAARAGEIGLVNRVCPSESLQEEAWRWISAAAAGSRPVLQLTKETLRVALESDFATLLQREADGQAACFGLRDFAEGLRAVFEKRSPRFEDR